MHSSGGAVVCQRILLSGSRSSRVLRNRGNRTPVVTIVASVVVVATRRWSVLVSIDAVVGLGLLAVAVVVVVEH
jgi:hypothetical protein